LNLGPGFGKAPDVLSRHLLAGLIGPLELMLYPKALADRKRRIGLVIGRVVLAGLRLGGCLDDVGQLERNLAGRRFAENLHARVVADQRRQAVHGFRHALGHVPLGSGKLGGRGFTVDALEQVDGLLGAGGGPLDGRL